MQSQIILRIFVIISCYLCSSLREISIENISDDLYNYMLSGTSEFLMISMNIYKRIHKSLTCVV